MYVSFFFEEIFLSGLFFIALVQCRRISVSFDLVNEVSRKIVGISLKIVVQKQCVILRE